MQAQGIDGYSILMLLWLLLPYTSSVFGCLQMLVALEPKLTSPRCCAAFPSSAFGSRFCVHVKYVYVFFVPENRALHCTAP